MPEKRIQFSNIVQNQLPAYTRTEFPLVSEFLKQYYLGQEYQGGPLDLIQNIDQYTKVSEQTNLVDSVGLSTSVDAFTDVIPVDMSIYPAGTNGFPDSYGLIKIDNEIITYTGTAATCFTGCVRGFCGISSYRTENKPDVLVFDSTTSEEHTGGSKIQNLSTLFLKEFLLKTKHQLLPGLEDRPLHEDLDQNIFIKQAKDFYLSKGTDRSFEILFKSLYNEDVRIIKPRDFLFTPSNANFRVTRDFVVENIVGEGNPIHLENSTLKQDEYKAEFSKAYAPISRVEPINTGAGTTYYKLSIDAGYNRDARVDGSIYGEFNVHPKTRVIGQVSAGTTSLDVDSTVGFPTSGELYCTYSDGEAGIVSYTSRNLTQFFGCTNINGTISNATNVGVNTYVYGVSSEDATKNVKVRIGAVLDKFDYPDNTQGYGKDDIAKIKTLGIEDKTFKGKDWFYNVASSYKILSVSLIDSSDFTYRVELSVDHYLKVGDQISVLQGSDELQTSTVLNINSAKSFNIKGQGIISDSSSLTFRRNILKGVSNTFPNVTPYSTNVQNVYRRNNDNYLVASSSIPSYYAQPLNVNSQAVVFSGTFSGTDFLIKQTGDHGFYTGDAVWYSPERVEVSSFDSFGNKVTNIVDGTELFDEGLYFVKRVDASTIKLATSRTNISNGSYKSIDTTTTVVNNRLEPYDFRFKTLQSQDILREFVPPVRNNEEPVKTVPGFTGLLVNGVEIVNYKASDNILYGQLDHVDASSPGRDYDVINPPILHISDNAGIGATGYVAVSGSLQDLRIIDPGFDYEETPTVTVNGGNGSGADVSVVMKQINHKVDFFADAASQKIGIGTTVNNAFQIGFSTYHQFRNAERVLYYTYSQTQVGGLTTNAQYYVNTNPGVTTVTLHKTEGDAISGINTITLTSNGIGKQALASVNKKLVVSAFNVINSGSGYENKQTTTAPSGINTATDTVTINNHGYNSGEIIKYTADVTAPGGLTSGTEYYLTKVNNNSFKLSSVGVNTNDKKINYRTKQYIDFTSIGVGTHNFNYQPITVTLKGKVGISSISGNTFQCEVQPIVRGEIKSVHLSDNGVGYGSSEIINFERQPEFNLIAGSQAQLEPVINNGQIQEVLVNNVGKEYNSPPDLVLIGDGVGGVITPVLENNTITSVKVIEKGAGYTQANTSINVVVPGSGAEFDATIENWRINLFQRHYDNFTGDDGFIADEFNQNKGLQYSHIYAPRKLREALYGTVGAGSTVSKTLYGKRDLTRVNSLEVASTDHSPIIGWAYDGNPIYGPYGYSKKQGGVVRQMKTGYVLSLKTGRPPISEFPAGFFVDDYIHNTVIDETVLDENNGRFCVTPEFPNGTYAYFATVNDGVADGSGPFAGYKRPTFPYLIGNSYNSTPNQFNFDSYSNQEQYPLNKTEWIRNTVAYNLIEGNLEYEYAYIPNKLKQEVEIKAVVPGIINKIGIQTSGTQYRVGDKVLFNNAETEGEKASAVVSKVIGKDVTNISVATSSITSVEVYPGQKGQYILYSNKPHGWADGDIIGISGLSTTSAAIGGNWKAGISTATFSLSGVGTNPTGIGSDGVTGIITYFPVEGDFSKIDPNDILKIGDEKIKVLAVEPENNRIRALRAQEGTSGAAHTVTTVLYEDPRKVTIDAGFSTTYTVKLNTELYFKPTVTASVGSSVISPAGTGIGSTATATAELDTFMNTGGTVLSISVTSAGDSYSTAPAVTITGPGILTATATVSVANSQINPASVSIGQSGAGYVTTPTLTISAPTLGSGIDTLAVGIPTISPAGVVTAIAFDWGPAYPWVSGAGIATIGYGYTTAPTLTFTDPTGIVTATATATLSGETVGSIAVGNSGFGYKSAPTVTIADPDSAPVYETGVGLGATVQLSDNPNYPSKRTCGTPVGGFPRGRSAAGAGLTDIKVPYKTIFLPNHGFVTGDQVDYYPNLGEGLLVQDQVVSEPTSGTFVGNTTSVLQSGQRLFIAKVTDDLIGIATVRVGLDTIGNNWVGIAESVRQSSTLAITGVGTGVEHSFKTVYNPITCEISRNLVTVSTGSTHGLLDDDEVDITVNPSSISTTFTVQYNDYNRRIVINPKDFTAAGVNTTTNEITINNHGFVDGQKIIHTATTSSVGLVNNTIYYVVRVDDNTLKLSENKYKATLLKPEIIGITSASAGTLNPVNPLIKVYKNQPVVFDLSSSTLGYVNQATTYSAFEFNLYADQNLTKKWDTDEITETFNVVRTGKAGVDADAKVELRVNKDIPSLLYYTLDILEESNVPAVKKSIIRRDSEVKDANEIETLSSGYDGVHKVSVGATNSFTYTLGVKPEKSSYISSTSVLSYETESETAFGGVAGFELKDGGQNYYSVPGITTIVSETGKGALIDVKADSIGRIKRVHLKDIGYNFPSDTTLRPSVGLPQIITIENLASIKSIGISSVGRGYTTAPKLIVFDGITNKQDKNIDLDYNLGDQQVSILKNTRGLSNVQPTIIPTNATNGVGINTVGFNTVTKDVSVTLAVGFSTAGSFPFVVGDKVLVEGVSVGLATTARGYNSAEYDYKLFEITAVDPNIGGLGIVTYSVYDYYSDLDPTVTPGEFNQANSVGRLIPEKYFPIFDVKLGVHDYLKGEIVSSNSAIGEVENWDAKLGELRVSASEDFKIDEVIIGRTSETQGVASSITTYESDIITNVSSERTDGWETDSGVLNYNMQRIQDSFYYQNFSYSLRSKVQYETWDDVVSSLNHAIGHIKFSDMQVDSLNDNSMTVGLTTESTSYEVVSDLYGIGNVNCFHDFDLVRENSKNVQGKVVSDEIIFDSRVLMDYDESIGNRVLSIDDVSGSFNHRPRATQYSIANEFDLSTTRSRKTFHYIQDKRFTGQRQLLVSTVIHDYMFGYLNVYGNGGNVYDIGSFDFAIAGGKGQLRFYPRNYKVNDYHLTSVSYNLEDEYLGIGTTSVGVALIESHSTEAAKSDASTVIVGIASTYRSAKVLVSINPDQSKTSSGEYEYDELNIIHDGSTIDLAEYGQLITVPGDVNATGFGTYSCAYSGSDIQLLWHPDSNNAGVGTTAVLNTITIGIGNSDYSGIGTFTMKHSKFDTRSTTIASASVGTTSVIGEYITQVSSTVEGYDAGYFIVQLTDTTNGSYNMAEMLIMDDYNLDDGGNTMDLEYGNNGVSGIATLGSRIVADTNAGVATVQLLCTPTANLGIQAQVFMQALKIEDDSKQNIEFNNGAVTSEYSDYEGTERDIKKAFDMRHATTPIFDRSFTGDSDAIVSVDNDTITIPNHFFVTGEKVTYTHVGTGSSGAVGIAATDGFAGVGNTTLLPSEVFVVKINEDKIKLAATAEKSLRQIAETVDITTVGVGTSHRFTSQDQNARVIVSLDNVIQSPVVATAVTTTLERQAYTTDDIVYFVGLTSFTGADLFRVGSEIMRIDSVGVGTTNAIRVRRQWLGTTLAGHSTGALVTKVQGNYNIVENVLNFTEAPYGYTPLSSTTNPPDDRDWTGIATSSSFNGRVFMRSGETDSSNKTYYNNYIFDDLSADFNGTTASFDLKTSGSDVTGIATENAVILLNDVFQGPVSNYDLSENAGVTSITFTGAGTSIASDVNTSQLPIGGVIVSVGSTEGMGYQPIVAAGGTVVVSSAGTVSAITIGYSGSGYRSGIGQTVRVAIQTSSLIGAEVVRYGTATVGNNGTITGIAITNTNVIYKPRDIQNVGYNSATGITTITTATAHGLSNGDSIKLSGIAFTCDYADAVSISTVGYTTSTGIMTVTTYSAHGLSTSGSRSNVIFSGLAFTCALDGGVYQHIYPRNKDRVFNTAVSVASTTSTTITVDVTAAKSLDQYAHTFVGPGTEAVIAGGAYGHKFIGIAQSAVVSGGDYLHTFVSSGVGSVSVTGIGTTTATDATYDAGTGDLVLTIVGHGATTGNTIGIDTGGIVFTCSMDNDGSNHAYPRSTDPLAGYGVTDITSTTDDTITINVGTSATVAHAVENAIYDAPTGILTMTIPSHGLSSERSIRFTPYSLAFTCDMDQHGSIHTYPRTTDPAYNTAVSISATTTDTITVNVGASTQTNYNVTAANYGAATGILTMTVGAGHSIVAGDSIKFKKESLTFTCTKDSNATRHKYPREGDPTYNGTVVTAVNSTTEFEVNIGISTVLSHYTGVGSAKCQPCIVAPRAVNNSTSKTDPAEPGSNILSIVDDYSFIVDTGVSTLPHNYARGGTVEKPLKVVIDEPLSYTNIPLDYTTPAAGVGTNATIDIVVSMGGSVRDFRINNSGNGYGNTEVLQIPYGGDTGIPTTSSFTNNPFELTIDEIYSDEFSGWSLGTLEALDDWDSKFDGNTVVFQLQRAGDTISIRSSKGSKINVQDVILVFINDILQVPGKGYKFNGGSNVTFTEAPKVGDTSKILFYKGSAGIDVKSKEIIETVKKGDNLTIENGSQPYYLKEDVRGVSTVTSTDTVQTVPYFGPGNTENEDLLRPVVWCKQTEDRVINEELVGKDRELYNANLNPTAYSIKTVGIGSTVIYVSNVRPFFDPNNENESATLRGTIQDKIDLITQQTLTGAAGTALVSTGGTVTGVTISDGGVGYSTATVSFASTTGVSTSTQAMGSLTIGAAGTITGVAITNPGVGYTQTSVPLVIFSPPTLTSETDTVRSYEGDSGVIVGFGTTTISSGTQLIFDLFIPLDSYLRDSTLTGTAVTICGIKTGDFFMVNDSNVGVGSTRITSVDTGDNTIGIGYSYADNVYEIADCEGQYINVTGVGFTYIKRVFAKIDGEMSGAPASGITSSNYQGSYSWGKIIVSRSEENSYTAYTQSGIGTNNSTGISTSTIIRRTNPLKSKSYT